VKSDESPPPLWLESIPDREPWRRGRDAIFFISLLVVLGQAALIAWSIMLGNLTMFLLAAGAGAVALALLYFVWIGHNWPRWLVAPLYALSGFGNVIWGMVNSNGPQFLLGLAGLTIFTYLALAPSVYAFARHQRERIGLTESLVVGGIFLLVLASVGSGLFGFYVYDTDLQAQATRFVGTTFNKVFLYHDDDFLGHNLKPAERPMTPKAFVEGLESSLGQPTWVGTPRGVFTTHFANHALQLTGRFDIPALFGSTSPIWINIDVSRIGDGWQIDHIGWAYSPRRTGPR
jgi:hypothetical protein